MIEMVSPVLLVWTIRGFDCCAAANEKDKSGETLPANTGEDAASPAACPWAVTAVRGCSSRHA
jgi:hypothetical protein